MPDFAFEKSHDGSVCGLDEVGRAPLAGPVVAACVYIPVENRSHTLWAQVNDSKLLSAKKRKTFAGQIKQLSNWAIAEATIEEVDQINIVQASFLAMNRAYTKMNVPTTLALIDGNLLPKSFPCQTQAIIKGDTKSVSIAAASIIAKTYRDALMSKLAEQHPYYGWERNSGYPSREHLNAIDAHGITPHHRKSFAPIKNFIEFGTTQRQYAMAL